MNPTFIIDENLPPALVEIFEAKGLSCVHVNQLKQQPKQRVIDDQIRRLAIRKGYIIVTRDDDFVKSFVSRKVPEKMLFVYGIEKKELLLQRMQEVIPQLSSWMDQYDFVEINVTKVRFPFAD